MCSAEKQNLLLQKDQKDIIIEDYKKKDSANKTIITESDIEKKNLKTDIDKANAIISRKTIWQVFEGAIVIVSLVFLAAK